MENDTKNIPKLNFEAFSKVLLYNSHWNERIAAVRAVKEKKNLQLMKTQTEEMENKQTVLNSLNDIKKTEMTKEIDVLRGQIGNIKGKLKNVAELLRIAQDNKLNVQKNETKTASIDTEQPTQIQQLGKISAEQYKLMQQSVRQMNLATDLVPTEEFLLSQNGEEIRKLSE